jgi:hypothetical protein
MKIHPAHPVWQVPGVLRSREEHSVPRLGDTNRRSRTTNTNTATRSNTTRDPTNARVVLNTFNALMKCEGNINKGVEVFYYLHALVPGKCL